MIPLPITDELSLYVRGRIAAFADEAFDPACVRAAEAVARYGALPVLFDWTATIALTPEGRFVMWSDEGEFEGLRPVEEPDWIRAALGNAAKRYPPLAALIPPRARRRPGLPALRRLGPHPRPAGERRLPLRRPGMARPSAWPLAGQGRISQGVTAAVPMNCYSRAKKLGQNSHGISGRSPWCREGRASRS